MVAHSGKDPESRSLKEGQLCWCEFDPWSWHKVVGKNCVEKLLAKPSVGQNTEIIARIRKYKTLNPLITNPKGHHGFQ